MTPEELKFTVGMDANSFNSSLQTIGTKVKEFGEKTSEHMDRAATSARGIHKVLGAIGEISPLVEGALTAAFSLPMLALMALVAGIKLIKDRFEESKKAAEQAGEAMRKTFEEDLRESEKHTEHLRTAKKQIAEREQETGKPLPEEEKKMIYEIQDAEEEHAKALLKIDQARAALVKMGPKELDAKLDPALQVKRAQERRELSDMYQAASGTVEVTGTRIDELTTRLKKLRDQEKFFQYKEPLGPPRPKRGTFVNPWSGEVEEAPMPGTFRIPGYPGLTTTKSGAFQTAAPISSHEPYGPPAPSKYATVKDVLDVFESGRAKVQVEKLPNGP